MYICIFCIYTTFGIQYQMDIRHHVRQHVRWRRSAELCGGDKRRIINMFDNMFANMFDNIVDNIVDKIVVNHV